MKKDKHSVLCQPHVGFEDDIGRYAHRVIICLESVLGELVGAASVREGEGLAVPLHKGIFTLVALISRT